MAKKSDLSGIDESLVARVAGMSRPSQRWLKTVLQAIEASDEEMPAAEAAQAGVETPSPSEEKAPRRPASLEDVVTGKADLRDHLDSYPELQEELDGLADVIDLLREAGERRRRKGEQILREEILGEKPEADEGNGRSKRAGD